LPSLASQAERAARFLWIDSADPRLGVGPAAESEFCFSHPEASSAARADAPPADLRGDGAVERRSRESPTMP